MAELELERDLRGLIREAPPPSEPIEGDLGVGPFDGLAERIVTVANGRGDAVIDVLAGAKAAVVSLTELLPRRLSSSRTTVC